MGASNQLLRLTAANYSDGFSQMVTGADPVAVGAVVFDQDGDMPNDYKLSDLFVSWGQFTDHDLSLTTDTSGEIVMVPGLVAPMERSIFDPMTGTTDAREQLNLITPEMDASMIYGSDAARLSEIRSFTGGQINMDAQGLLPLTTSGMASASETKEMFLAGDVRANENTGLTTLHTLFAREHNHWADRLATENPTWTDEEIFTAARSIVEAELQKITYNDWLPHLVGDAVGADTGFDDTANGQISTEFSTAAFRFGHTMVSSLVQRLDEDGSTSEGGHISVQNAFFNIDEIQAHGIDEILRGQAGGMAQMSDATMIDDLNFFLELPNGLSGFSLASLNVLRARDHGLGSYVDVRAALLGDIDPATVDPTDFSIISSDAEVQTRLASVYGSVQEVELWVGGLAEDNISGTQLGPLFSYIVADQFNRTRAADDTFGTLDPLVSAEIEAEIATTTLSDIITRNSAVEFLQQDAFVVAERMAGTEQNDTLHGDEADELIMGLGGRDYIYARKGNDDIHAGNGHDVVFAGEGDDYASGGLHDDRLDGGTGNDTLEGDEGRDILRGGGDDDLLDGGADNDRIHGDGGNDTLLGGDGLDAMFGGNGDDLQLGGLENDRLQGGDGNDTLSGDEGNDIVKGDFGDDLVLGGTGNDRLYGGADNDTLQGGEGNDVLFDNRGDDMSFGGAGDDRLVGGEGNDTLDGGTGTDQLRGGEGADKFIFALGSGKDTIMDFVIGEDVIEISGFGLNTYEELMAYSVSVNDRIRLDFGNEDYLSLGWRSYAEISDSDFLFT